LTSFLPELIHDARFAILESESVVDFVLCSLRDIPCNLPLRWGVLFNLKFRRVFQCLNLQKWNALLHCFKKYSYAIVLRGSVHFVDPTLNAPERIYFHESQVSQITNDSSNQMNGNDELDEFNDSQIHHESQGSQNVIFDFTISDKENDSGAIPVSHVSNPQIYQLIFKIDPFKTPERANNTNVHSFLFNSQPLSSSPVISIEEAVTTVSRAKNDSIYALNLSNSSSPEHADRFDTTRLPKDLVMSIRRLYAFSDFAIESIFNTLRELPVSIPLRWGCIYNKYLRVRSKIITSKKPMTTLFQWKQLRDLLIQNGYLDNKTVINCSILINK
jgi:hypothetical protein